MITHENDTKEMRVDDFTIEQIASPYDATSTAMEPSLGGSSASGGFRGFFSLMRSAIRAGFFLPFATSVGSRSWMNFVWLLVISVVVQFAGDIVSVGVKGEISFYGLSGVLFFLPISLVAAICTATLAKRREKVRTVFVVLSAVCVFFQLIYLISFELFDRNNYVPRFSVWSWLLNLLPYFWFCLACGVAAMRILKLETVSKRITIALLGATLMVAPYVLAHPNTTLWRTAYDSSDETYEDRYDVLNTEEAMFHQPKLLTQALENIRSSEASQAQVFFVAVAGDASQDVFMKEVNFVDQLFAERFNTKNHRAILINNKETLERLPIASLTGLQMTLERVGKVMRPDQDVLFLYLSSHGSKSHEFSLEFGGMRFKSLNPQVLNLLLNQAGIKNRIIVISACYSGGFIETLKNENSLIITSAAKDKTSFGCSNEADFTYFGKAYFADALKENRSFIAAFEQAKPAISEREKHEDNTPSEPQMYVGEKIRPIIESLAKQSPVKVMEDAVVSTLSAATPDQLRRLELARELFALFENGAMLESYFSLCKEYQNARTAEMVVANNSDYFAGITTSSAQWPKVAKAFRDYQTESCKGLGLEEFAESYVRIFSAAHSVKELESLIKFHKSPLGRKAIATTNHATLSSQKQFLVLSGEIGERASLQFTQTIQALAARENRK